MALEKRIKQAVRCRVSGVGTRASGVCIHISALSLTDCWVALGKTQPLELQFHRHFLGEVMVRVKHIQINSDSGWPVVFI